MCFVACLLYKVFSKKLRIDKTDVSPKYIRFFFLERSLLKIKRKKFYRKAYFFQTVLNLKFTLSEIIRVTKLWKLLFHKTFHSFVIVHLLVYHSSLIESIWFFNKAVRQFENKLFNLELEELAITNFSFTFSAAISSLNI